MEAEFRSAASGTQELLWLEHLIAELGSKLKLELVTGLSLLKDDNQGAIAAMKKDVQHSKLKHLELKYYFLKKVVEEKRMDVEYCPTDEMIADVLTKALGRQKFEYFTARMEVGHRPKRRIELIFWCVPEPTLGGGLDWGWVDVGEWGVFFYRQRISSSSLIGRENIGTNLIQFSYRLWARLNSRQVSDHFRELAMDVGVCKY